VSGFVALVMLILGISLLDVFPFVKKLQIKMPKSIERHVTRWGVNDHVLAPLLFGIGTFFLPCGFTQSMQLAALSTGSFIQGSLIMFSFALGTLPVLVLISFGSLNIAHQSWRKVFFRVAGVLIIGLALFNIMATLSVLGVITPVTSTRDNTVLVAPIREGKQIIDITARVGYSPRVVVAKAGVPTILRMTTDNTYDCSASLAIPKISYREFLPSSGVVEIPISAEQAQGTLDGLCAMGMYNFQIRFKP
jgi:hypothetical protein